MKRILFILLAMFIMAQAYTQQARMIDQIKMHKTGLAVWWIGQNSWIIKSDSLVIATDLYLLDNLRINPSPITPEELASVIDISFITHQHGDHFGVLTASVLMEKSSCLFVMSETCLPVAQEIGIPEDRIIIAKPREPCDIKGIKVNPLRAIHGNKDFAIFYDANFQDCGYLFTIKDKTFLQPGDSYLLEDHLFLKNVDVLFFSPTEHNTYINPSVIMINRLNPKYIFPQHHGTLKTTDENRFWTKGYPDEVKIRLTQSLKDRYHILKPGDMMLLKL